jgi:hypothetical protein
MNINDESEIHKISIYYARGVDTLGNEGDLEKALEYLRKGFSENCVFEFYWPDGSSFGKCQGLIEFANFGLSFMKDKKYRNTQHFVSNFLVEEMETGEAKLESSVIARHIKSDNSQDIAIANNVDKVILENGNWKCCERKCIQFSFDNFAPEYSLS